MHNSAIVDSHYTPYLKDTGLDSVFAYKAFLENSK